MNLNEIQKASQEQFARQSHRYGQGHILENVADVQAALGSFTLPLPARFQTGDGPSSAVIERFDPDQTRLFREHHIEVPFVRWGTPPRRWFRISAQAYNSLEDYERLAAALA